MATLEDLGKLLDEEDYKEIPVASLTKSEREFLEKAGMDLTGTTVRVKVAKKPKAEKAIEAASVEKIESSKLESVSNVPVASRETPIEETVEEEEPKETPPDPFEVEEYLRCTLGMLPYSKTYKILKNSTVTFKARSALKNLALAGYMHAIRNMYGFINTELSSVAMYQLQLLLTCSNININGNNIEVPTVHNPVDFHEVKKLADSLTENMPQAVYSACLDRMFEFDKLVSSLNKTIADSNF